MDGNFYIIFTRSIMGNNGGLSLRVIITHYYMQGNNEFIFTCYDLLLHVIAYCCIH